MEEGLCPPALRLPRSHASTASRTVFVGGRGERTEREAADRGGPIEYARSAPEQVAERMETAQSDGRGTDEWPVRADRWAELLGDFGPRPAGFDVTRRPVFHNDDLVAHEETEVARGLAASAALQVKQAMGDDITPTAR